MNSLFQIQFYNGPDSWTYLEVGSRTRRFEEADRGHSCQGRLNLWLFNSFQFSTTDAHFWFYTRIC